MAVDLFGFRIGRADEEQKQAIEVPSFAPEPNDDGATEVVSNHVYGTALDFEGTAKSEAELVTKYREMSLQPECDTAVDDIVNEAIVVDDRKNPVNLVLD